MIAELSEICESTQEATFKPEIHLLDKVVQKVTDLQKREEPYRNRLRLSLSFARLAKTTTRGVAGAGEVTTVEAKYTKCAGISRQQALCRTESRHVFQCGGFPKRVFCFCLFLANIFNDCHRWRELPNSAPCWKSIVVYEGLRSCHFTRGQVRKKRRTRATSPASGPESVQWTRRRCREARPRGAVWPAVSSWARRRLGAWGFGLWA